MDVFYKVWEAAKKIYELERTVHIDLEEAYIRIYLAGSIIVRVDGTHEELEEMYTTAAARLLDWMQQRKKHEKEMRYMP